MKILITENQYKRILNEDDNSLYDEIKNYISKESELTKKAYGKSKVKIVDTSKIIDKIKNFLISKIPNVIGDMKKGINGENFAKECYEFIYKTVNEELNNLNFLEKNSIKLIAGGKENIKKHLEQRGRAEIDVYLENLLLLMDFSFPIGYREDMKNFQNQLTSWYKNMDNWFNQRINSIGSNIINLIVSKFD